MLELGEYLLDGIEVWAIGWEEQDFGACRPDRGADIPSFMTAEIIEDDDVAGRQGRNEDLLDIETETVGIDRSVDHPGRVDAVMAKSRQESHGVPMTKGRLGVASLPSATPSPQRRHVGFDPRFVEKNQTTRVKFSLVRFPSGPFPGHIGAILLAGQQRFF